MTNSAETAREQAARLTYPQWRDRLDEYVSLAGRRATHYPELVLRAMYAAGLTAGRAGETLVGDGEVGTNND